MVDELPPLSRAAEDDIIGIAKEGVRLFGPAQARQYHDDLFAIFDLIAANPRMARERHELSPPMRIHPFKAHLVIYRVEEDGVLIIRVRHGHEDWASEGERYYAIKPLPASSRRRRTRYRLPPKGRASIRKFLGAFVEHLAGLAA